MQPVEAGEVFANDYEIVRAFRERGQLIMHSLIDRPRPEEDTGRRLMHYALARLGTGREIETALRDIDEVNGMDDNGGMFFSHVNMDAYLRFGHLYPEALREKVRRRMTDRDYTVHHGHTENHRMMIAVGGYLAAQTWPEWQDAQETFTRNRDYLRTFFDRVTRFGQGEFDSTTYSVFYPITLCTLYDFAHDPLMRQQAKMMISWFLTNTAGEWLNGHFAGAHSRDVFTTSGPEFASAGVSAAWLYFGGQQPDLLTGEPHYCVIPALSAYQLPAILARIARDRRQPYEHRETHDLVDIAGESHDLIATKPVNAESKGYGYISQVGIRKYTYMTPDYALGSMNDGTQGDLTGYGATRRWSLEWLSDQPHSSLFFTHPFPDSNKGDEQYRYKWQGSSPFEQVAQAHGVLLALYNIPETGTYYHPYARVEIPANQHPYIDGYVSPQALLQVLEDPSGWIFCHGGSVLIAIRPLKPYHWVDEHYLHAGRPELARRERRLRSEGHKNGVIIDTANPATYLREGEADSVSGTVQRFREAVLALTHIDASGLDDSNPSVSYHSLAGDTIAFTYNGARVINGEAVDYQAWPLIANPFIYSAVNSRQLALRYGGHTLNFDYRQWSTTESVEA